jgi:hypothetical protein
MRAADFLAAYSINSLRTLARTRGYPIQSTRRTELVDSLAQRLWEPAEVARLVVGLTEHGRAILEELRQLGGRASVDELSAAVTSRGVEPSRPSRPRESVDRIPPETRRFDELCARLTARGLLFSESEMRGPLAQPLNLNPGPVLVAPGVVLRALDQTQAIPEEGPPQTIESNEGISWSGDPRLEAVRGRLIVQPSFALLLLPPFDDATVLRLDAIAERVRMDETAEWRFSQSSWYAALQRGADAQQIGDWLVERSGAALPQNVAYTLREWTQLTEQVVLHSSAAVIAGDAAQLDRLEALPQIQPLVVARIATERLLLRDGHAAERVLRSLEEPALSQRYDRPSTGPQIVVDDDGTITVLHHGTATTGHLFLPLALERFCRRLGQGRYAIDRERLRQAVVELPDGLTGILQLLRTYAQTVPPKLVTRLRTWAEGSPVRLERPLLLRLRSEQLQILRADAELAPLLAAAYAPEDVLISVEEDGEERLRALLSARGIDL